MKKSLKKLLIVGGAFSAVGIIIMLIGFASIGWDPKKLDAAEYTAKTYTAPSDMNISRVEIDVASFPVVVTGGDGVALDYYEASDSVVSVTDDDGVLKITEKHTYNPFKSGVFNLRFDRKYMLTVNSGMQFDIKSRNGNIVFDGLESEEFGLNVSNADVIFKGCSVDNLDIESSNADIEFEGCKLGDVAIDVTNCHMRVTDTSGKDLTVKSTNLNARFIRSAFDNLSLDSINLDCNVTSGEYASIVMRGTNTDVDIENVVADRVDISGANLDADIVISGDFAEYSVQTQGKNMPSDRVGNTDKIIKLSGTNNDVTLKFV